jgi:hypothetical protein
MLDDTAAKLLVDKTMDGVKEYRLLPAGIARVGE